MSSIQVAPKTASASAARTLPEGSPKACYFRQAVAGGVSGGGSGVIGDPF